MDAPWEDFKPQAQAQPDNSSAAPWEDFQKPQSESFLDKAKGAMDTVGQAFKQAKENPAYATSPQGLLESGYELSQKGAGKVGDYVQKHISEGPEGVDPTTAKIVGKTIGLAPDILSLGIPTGASEGAAEGLENFAGKKAIQSLELPGIGEMAPAERQGLADFIQNNNLVGRDKEEILEHARNLSKGFGEKIGEIGDNAGKEALTVDRPTLEKNIQSLIQKGQEYKGYENPKMQELAKDYSKGANDIFNKIFDKPTWDEIQKVKENYGKIAFNTNSTQGEKDTYFALKDMLKNIADQAQSNPHLADEYKNALAGYSKMHPIVDSLEKSVSGEYKGGAGMGVRGAIGLIKRLPGPVRAIAGPVAVMMGHPYLGAAAALPELTNPAIQSKAASLAAKGLPAGEQALRDYLMREFGNKNAD